MDLDNKIEEIEKVDADSTTDTISFTENSAVQIVNINQETKEFELNEEGLSSILNHEKAKNKPVVVLSIAGDFRKGKSFILNFFLRYLKAAESNNAENWLPDGDQPLKGFSWRSGMEADTSGILLWSEPFNLKLENGEEVAVLLMDTQGCFDTEHTFRESATVFALSTMLSSIQVYNIFHNLQEDNLQFLQVYTEYGRLALENSKKSPFQKLVFLVRDWGFPFSCPFGIEGGKKALNERLAIKENQEPQLKQLRENLTSCFEEINCYLMPYPGKKVATNPNFDGRISDIDEEFVEHLRLFVPSLFDIKNLPIKEIAGSKVTGNQLIEYFKVYFNTFKSNEIPEPKSIMEATSEANNFIALSSARASYIQEMEEVCGSKRPYVNPKYLEAKHNEIYKRSLNCFYEFKKFGGEEFSKPFLEKLEKELSVEFEKYKDNNNAKNIFAVVGAPLIFLLHAIMLSVISKFFDILGITILANFIFFFVTITLVTLVLYLFLKMQGTFPEFVQGLDDVADKIKSIGVELMVNYFGRNSMPM